VAVGYLLERYPVVSQTFVSNEVTELRRQGVDVVVTSLWAGDDVGADDRADLIVHEAMPRRRRLALDHLTAMARNPLQYLRFLGVVRALGDEARVVGWQAIPSLARLLRQRNVDRLHAHFAWGGAAVAAALAALTGWPWALTVHARDIFAERRNLALKLRRTDRLITVCDYNRRFLVEELGYDRPVSIIVCGVTLPEPSATQPPTDPRVVFVGRLVEKKGAEVLLRAAAELLPSTPELRVDLVGDGPLRDSLRSLANSLGLQGVVGFHGTVSHGAALDLIGHSAVLCLPSRVAADGDVDSMPLVVKEAMVRGVAVAGCDVGGVSEMIADGCGELVAPDDAAALSGALRRLLSDPAHRAACVARARERARARFVLADQVGELRSILSGLSPGS
jgi:colanic acid/amylovoran biosynthesis glycosyltransferase